MLELPHVHHRVFHALAHSRGTVAEQVDRIRKVPGVGEFAMIVNFGGIEHEKALKTLDLFARRVMPALGLGRKQDEPTGR